MVDSGEQFRWAMISIIRGKGKENLCTDCESSHVEEVTKRCEEIDTCDSDGKADWKAEGSVCCT